MICLKTFSILAIISNHISTVQSISYGYCATAEDVYHTRNAALLLFSRHVWLFRDPKDCTLPGSSVHGNLQATIPGVGCHFLLQGIFLTQEANHASYTSRNILYHWATFKWPNLPLSLSTTTTKSCLAMPKNWTKMHVLGSWNEPFLLQIQQPKSFIWNTGVLIIVHMLGNS